MTEVTPNPNPSRWQQIVRGSFATRKKVWIGAVAAVLVLLTILLTFLWTGGGLEEPEQVAVDYYTAVYLEKSEKKGMKYLTQKAQKARGKEFLSTQVMVAKMDPSKSKTVQIAESPFIKQTEGKKTYYLYQPDTEKLLLVEVKETEKGWRISGGGVDRQNEYESLSVEEWKEVSVK